MYIKCPECKYGYMEITGVGLFRQKYILKCGRCNFSEPHQVPLYMRLEKKYPDLKVKRITDV